MSLAVAIIGDDLTGTLDAAAPFAARGLSTAIALTPDDAPEALASGAEIVAVNTASRALSAEAAAIAVGTAAAFLAAARPMIAFKKIDSRLKGNLASEADAAMLGFGRMRATICPAIVDFGRIVQDGTLRGFGVAQPIDVAERFAIGAARVTVPDARGPDELDAIAAGLIDDADEQLAIGARGLAEALAMRLSETAAPRPAPLAAARPILFAIASRDPITLEQVGRLRDHIDPDAVVLAPNGLVQHDGRACNKPIGLVVATDGDADHSAEAVAERFAVGVAAMVGRQDVGTLVLCGGDTAFAVLRALGIRALTVGGEAAPGVPWVSTRIGGRSLTILTKSGGFGTPDELVNLTSAPDQRDSAGWAPIGHELQANGTRSG